MMNIFKYRLAALLLMASFSAVSMAQTLSLEEARARALEHNKQIAIAQEKMEGALQTRKAMKTNYLPKLSGTALAYYAPANKTNSLELGTIPLPESFGKLPELVQQFPQLAPILAQLSDGITLPPFNYQLKMGNSYFASVMLTQPIYMGGKITASNKMAQIATEMAKHSYKLTQDEVYLATDEAYWKLVEVMELQATAEAYVKTIGEIHRIVNNAVREGMRTKADVLRVEVEQSNAVLQLERARNGVRLARMNLCRVIGLPLTEAVSPSEKFDHLPLPETNIGDLSRRPEYALLNDKVALKEAQIRLTRSDYLPQLGVRAGYNYMRGIKLNDRLLMNDANPSVMFSLNVPIFNWGEGRAKVRAARSEQRIAEYEREELSEKMLLEQQKALNHCHEQYLEVELTRRNIAQAEELLRQTHNRYEAGLDTTSELLEVETLAVKARGEHISAKAKYMLSHTALKKALGQL